MYTDLVRGGPHGSPNVFDTQLYATPRSPCAVFPPPAHPDPYSPEVGSEQHIKGIEIERLLNMLTLTSIRAGYLGRFQAFAVFRHDMAKPMADRERGRSKGS